AQTTAGDAPGRCQLVMDCISRALFLGDHFQRELDAFSQPGLPMLGALTIGEIANHGDDYLEFYNKTAVVGILE
ncbi:MAG TPA: histidine kinase, partial [Chromatiaceae bacterium]|nr:histidine kinase [Chromatiaceae bacterium]